jgi:hypothetical protein
LITASVRAGEQAAVVVDNAGKVTTLIVQPGPVTVQDLKENYHEVGEADPDFVPPPESISEPEKPTQHISANEIPVREENAKAPTSSVVAFDFSGPSKPRTPVDQQVEAPLPQPLYEPNQNNIIVLPGRHRFSSDEGIANPFDIRVIAAKSVNEVKIKVGGVVMGGQKPTAIVNGRPLSANDRWSGFNVVSVRRDALLLERDGVFVLIPRGRDISIKIPL